MAKIHFIQAIEIPNTISPTIFKLDVVESCHKLKNGEVLYELREKQLYPNGERRPIGGTFVKSGQMLCQDTEGWWHRLSKEHYQTIIDSYTYEH